MSRLAPIDPENFAPEQKQAYEEVLKRFPRLGGPYEAYIRVPDFLHLNKSTGDYLRNNSVPERHRVIVVLTTAHFWQAKFVWGVNVRNSLAKGFDQAIVDAIADESDRLVYRMTAQLLDQKSVSDDLYQTLFDAFGEIRLVDLVATVGFYSSVCLTTLFFGSQPPADAQYPLLKPGQAAE